MSGKIGIVYNDPVPGVYHNLGEDDAVAGILDSVAAVSQALEHLGYEVVTLALGPPLPLAESELRKLDVDAVFNLFEGFGGVPQSEATVTCLLETMGICFTGCPSQALHLCEDKSLAKQVLQSWDIPTANWQVLAPSTCTDFNLNFPCIVKPLGEHASHGISAKSIVRSLQALRRQLELIDQKYGRPSLVEEFLPGREFSALVVGNYSLKVFPIEEIIFALPSTKPPILTYGAKWVREDTYFEGTKTKCPADVDPELKQAIDDLALRCFVALGCRGYARVDMRQDAGGQLMVLDVNPNPDISQEGGARHQVEAAGIAYASFIGDIVSLAKEHFDSARVTV
ncbi:MAG: ATP-grasp domain-containing protein [Chloroflexi bacterium]|nr:ATP-grasp domain-containing protein [Chloroflexota bacterium]